MSESKKYRLYPLPFIFMIMLVLPALNNLTHIWENERNEENRIFHDSVKVNVNKLDNLPGDFNDFLSDNFGFRRALLDLRFDVSFYFFHTSPRPDITLIGDNGWYFLSGKEIEVYEGNKNFSQDDLDCLTKEWEARINYLNSKNIKVYWLISPVKHSIYYEYLPLNLKRAEVSRIDLLKAHFKQKFPNLIIDPKDEIITGKSENKMYYQLDNHWNFHAGYTSTQKILSIVKIDFPQYQWNEMPQVIWTDTAIQEGYHYTTLGVTDLVETDQTFVVKNKNARKIDGHGFPCPEGFPYCDEFEHVYVNDAVKSKIRLLMIRDSFCRQMIPFVVELFHESVFIFDSWQYNMNKDIVEVINPDIVVFQTLETNIDGMVKNYKDRIDTTGFDNY